MITDVIIPALNEEQSIGKVISSIQSVHVRNIIVSDNGSTDNTKANAIEAGAIVVSETERGYGAACLKAMEYIGELEKKPDIVAFMDGDYSDYPEELDKVIGPIINENKHLVIGSRVKGNRQKGSLTPQQVFGNRIAVSLLQHMYGIRYTDLGPFRAISYPALLKLEMRDRNFGWTVEMQLKAAKYDMNVCEVPVSYRNRIGRSKVSGTIKGSVMAGVKIIATILKFR